MATYPDDATAPITPFSVVGEQQFDNTGASTTDFNFSAFGKSGYVKTNILTL